jgi:tetratricopeptide (TPR) repeat protein
MRSFRQPLLVIALLGVAVAVPAFAQQPSQYPAPCDASKVSRSDVERAHTVFLSGKQYLDESNYDKAISYFKDAYSIDCSVHKILPIIATAYERKGDKTEAIRALEEYLKRAPSGDDREVIERRIRNLKEQLAASGAATAPTAPPSTATPSAPPTSTVPPVASPPPLTTVVPPPSSTTQGEVPPPSGGGHTAGPWVLFGVGAAVMATGVALLAVGASDISSAEGACPNRMCPASNTSAKDQGNTGRALETTGGVALGVGGAAAVAGLIWHFVERPKPSPSGTGTTLTPTLGTGYAGLTFEGRF